MDIGGRPADNPPLAMLPEHSITFRVRYPEVDQMGVVHHSRFFEYFEMGRVELLRANGMSYAELERSGVLFVVVKVECRYRAPARYDDELTLTTRVARMAHVKIDHEYVLRRGETVLAEGKTTIACVDREGNLREIPAGLGGS
jgi:acyl-CoA thioester hydrolase